jgi:hypothetical protein
MPLGAYVAGLVLTTAILGWLAWRQFVIVMILFVPIFAWFASRVLVTAGVNMPWSLARHARKEWNGRYYEYGQVHLRAWEVDARLVFAEDDLLSIVAQPHSKTVELFGAAERLNLQEERLHVLTESGCERLLVKCPHPEANRLLHCLQREALGPYGRRKEMARA